MGFYFFREYIFPFANFFSTNRRINIWIINPFDELPNATDIPQRYWALSRTLARAGHTVTWWTSNFSHRTKSYRQPCSPIDGFAIRQVSTPAYKYNVSFRRLFNHQAFSKNVLRDAESAIASGEIEPPERIVISLPPLGTAKTAFHFRQKYGCEVILDIMDAWPETFIRLIPAPKKLAEICSRIVFAPLYSAARFAMTNADRISGVSNIYVNLAKENCKKSNRSADPAFEKNFHLCYHGFDFFSDPILEPKHLPLAESGDPVRLVYIGAIERSYDLEAIARALSQLHNEKVNAEFHIAGAGTFEADFRNFIAPLPFADKIYFHGLLDRKNLVDLLDKCHFGIIPMRQDSFVGLPYKITDYSAAGLVILSSLAGECKELLVSHKAGKFYFPGSSEKIAQLVQFFLKNPVSYTEYSYNAKKLAQSTFDRNITYPALANFIVTSNA